MSRFEYTYGFLLCWVALSAAPSSAVAQTAAMPEDVDPIGIGWEDDEEEDAGDEGEEASADEIEYLNSLSLEELIDVDVGVTTLGKKVQTVNETAASVDVITSETIRRSGLTSIPEILRLVPGLHVARLNSSVWAITSRGFNSQFANKMLVMIDGRTVYTPLHSGVFWSIQDLVLEDIERIEVIRGPGASLWGANAVNGVINIVTKSAADTEGGLASVVVGNEDELIMSARYGITLENGPSIRAYAKYLERDGLHDFTDLGIDDAWDQGQAGFRLDWELTDNDLITLQGDIFDGESPAATNSPHWNPPAPFLGDIEIEQQGGNVLTRWTHALSDDSEFAFQAYFDRVETKSHILNEDRDMIDLEFHHRLPIADSHELMWGVGYRVTNAVFGDADHIQISDDRREDRIYSGFIQDEISLSETTRLLVGVKLEDNDFTDFEIQPNARFSWLIDEDQTFWTSVSRAVRTPSVVEHTSFYPIQYIEGEPVDTLVAFVGDEGFDSEEVIAYEAGYRLQVSDELSFDLAAYYNDYDDLLATVPREAGFQDGVFLIELVAVNGRSARSYGGEFSTRWDVTEDWELTFGYSHIQMNVDDETGGDGDGETVPENQVHVRSFLDLGERWELDALLFYVDRLEDLDIDAYVRADVRLGFNPTPNTNLSLGVQGLFHDEELEFPSSAGDVRLNYENQYAAYFKLTLRF